MINISKSIILLLLIASHPLLSEDINLRAYCIGNSLSWDIRPDYLSQSLKSAGYNLQIGWHIACSRSLTEMVRNPDYICQTKDHPYGKWQNALANYEWDVVTFQSYPYPEATAETELAAISTMIDWATSGDRNQDCIFYLYVPWPEQSSITSWHAQWAAPYDDPSELAIKSKAYYECLYAMLKDAYPQKDIRIIPVGHALAQLDLKLAQTPLHMYQDDEAEAQGVYDLYRDSLHMAGAGKYVAHATVVACLLNLQPSEVSISGGVAGLALDSDYTDLVKEVVWSIVTNYSGTGAHETEPTIHFRKAYEKLEVSYRGCLLQSFDLKNWSEVESASPYRFDCENVLYFRALVQE